MNITIGTSGLKEGQSDSRENRDVLLFVFGPIEGANGPLSANYIREQLFRRNVWLTARMPSKELAFPVKALFYKVARGKERGIVASASVIGVRETVKAKTNPCPGLPLQMFPWLLDLADIHTFDPPIALGPLVNELSFVANKVYWGHSLRLTPRLIPDTDYNRIVSSRRA